MYDYKTEMKKDIINAIMWDINDYDFSDKDELFDALYDEFFIRDSITGNASGSYFFSRYKAAEALAGNTDLVAYAFDYYCVIHDGMKTEDIERILEPEYQDVTVRCYLLNEVLYDVLDELFSYLEEVDEITNEIITKALEEVA